MKKRITLIKSLLIAATLLVGGANSVWADEINATLVHTASSGVPSATAGAYVSTIDAAQEYINNSAFGNKNWQGAAYAEFSFMIPKNHSIKSATMVWNGVGSGKDRTTDVMYVSAGESLDYTASGLGSGNAEVNLPSTKITTVTFPKNTTKEFTTDVTDALKAVAETQSYIIFKFTNNVGSGNLVGKGAETGAPTLVITTADASSLTSYTVKFTDGTNDLKDAAVYTNVAIGSEQTASAEDMAAFKADGKKYKYVSGNTTITTVADGTSNVITLVFTEATKYTYTLKDNFGNTIVTGTDYEDEEIVMPYSRYFLQGTTLYEASATNKEYRKTITLNEDNKVETVTYESKAGDVVFFTEAENIEGVTQTTTGNLPVRASNAAGATTENELTITTLSAGKYKLHAGLFTSKKDPAGLIVNIGVGAETYNAECASNNLSEVVSSEYTLTENTDIKFLGITGDAQFDYIWIEKTDAPETVTIGADGFASFSSAKALDFTGTTIKAYVATAAADGVVTMSRVNKVPANTGLIVQGTTASIPVVNGEAETISTNLLKPGTGANVAASTEGTYHYVFAKQSDKFGFYNLTADTKVVKGKAYLETTTALAAEARLVFVDETTGIANVNNQMNDVKSIFNLNGQRVEKAQKGLFIVNGKKVLVK